MDETSQNFCFLLDKGDLVCYNRRREGVACAFGVASQHTDPRIWLAFNRETHGWQIAVHGLSLYADAKHGSTALGFFIAMGEGMTLNFSFFFTAVMLGVGLAMDAFSVSLANGLNEPTMKKPRMLGVAGIFAAFQFLMPLIGWVCVSTVARLFGKFEVLIPWIALGLLGFLGGKMLWEGLQQKNEGEEPQAVGLAALLLQGVATSIDALSVGFTISSYDLWGALLSCAIIGVVTFFICLGGIAIGRRAGTGLAGKAGILGGAILIFIGLEIFITSWF